MKTIPGRLAFWMVALFSIQSIFSQNQAGTALATPDSRSYGVDPVALLESVERLISPDSYRMRVKMDTSRPGRSDTGMTMDIRHKHHAGTLIEILEPIRSRGIRFLERNDTMWFYNPRAGTSRVVRLSARDVFQGSVFSNEDVGSMRYLEDYDVRLDGMELYMPEVRIDPSGGTPTQTPVQVHTLSATPKQPNAAYARILFLIRVRDSVPLRIDYHARSGHAIKTMHFGEFVVLAGKLRPTLYLMVSRADPGVRTTMRIQELELLELADSLFEVENLAH